MRLEAVDCTHGSVQEPVVGFVKAVSSSVSVK